MPLSTLGSGLLVAALSASTSACARHGQASLIDEDAYARANHSLYHHLPAFPGAVFVSRTDSPYQHGQRDDGDAPIAGIVTVYVLRLPASTRVGDVARFYRERLARTGWRLRERLPGLKGHAGPVFDYRRHTALVSINLEGGFGHQLEIDLDRAGA